MSLPVALLADDSEDDVALALQLMAERRFPFEVRVASDGQEAWQALSAMSEPPALIILDVKMPKLGGLDLLERVRAELGWRQVPVVILTSSDDPRDIDRAASLGATAYVRKPSALEDFIRVIDRLKTPALLAGPEMQRW